MEYYSAIKRNTFESVLTRWMNLKPIIQSEVSQKEKDKYHILTHIFGKLSSGHRTGKGQFSSQSQRKAMPKNAQTTAQLHSSHMLVK